MADAVGGAHRASMANEATVDAPRVARATRSHEDDVVDGVVAEVVRFATRVIEPKIARPEHAMRGGEVSALLEDARALGVVASEEENGVALWQDSTGAVRSTRVLAALARVNAGFALAAHQTSLARWALRRMGATAIGFGAFALHAGPFLGRASLARHLHDAPLEADDHAVLVDVFGALATRIMTTPAFAWLVACELDDRGDVQLVLRDAPSLERRDHARAHGLDELATSSVRPREGVARTAISRFDPATARDVLAESIARASLGYVAVALGAAQRAHRLARRHASLRVQGGCTIDRHPAVQLLLASSARAIDAVDAQLETIARAPLDRSRLRRVLSLRAEAHPLLCRATNDALQVFGGSGYMRDVGLEKIVRDQNHLRVTCGSPSELSLVVAEWERLDG